MKKSILYICMSLFIGSFSGCGGGGSSSVDEIVENVDKTIILPLYAYDSSLWEKVVGLSTSKVVAIVNPDNGAGFNVEELYKGVISKLSEKGKRPIGYIMTAEGERDLDDFKKEIDRWISLYPDIEGFFLDEVANGKFDYYKEMTEYIKSKNREYFIALNPGTKPDKEYFSISDLIVVFEGDVQNYESDFCLLSPEKSAIIVYNSGLSDMLKLFANSKCKYLYSTDDSGSNPYDSLASYFTKEIDILK